MKDSIQLRFSRSFNSTFCLLKQTGLALLCAIVAVLVGQSFGMLDSAQAQSYTLAATQTTLTSNGKSIKAIKRKMMRRCQNKKGKKLRTCRQRVLNFIKTLPIDTTVRGGGLAGSRLPIDVTDSLAILPALTAAATSAPATAPSANNRLVRINNSVVQEVEFLDQKGLRFLYALNPLQIFPIDENFIILVFGQYIGNPTEAYLVRLSDGLIFDLTPAGIPTKQVDTFINQQQIQKDAQGLVYFAALNTDTQLNTNDQRLLKLDLSDLNSPVASVLTPDIEFMTSCQVEPGGNLYYTAFISQPSGFNGQVRRFIMKAGNLLNTREAIYWRDYAGRINLSYSDAQSQGRRKVARMIFAPDGTAQESVLWEDQNYIWSGYSRENGSYLFNFPDHTILVSTQPQIYSSGIMEISNPTNTPRKINGLPALTPALAAQSASHYYIFGYDSLNQPMIIKVNPEDDTFETLLELGQYDLYHMAVDSAGEVTFNGLHLPTNTIVIGRIDSSGNVTIVDSRLNVRAITLVPIGSK